MTTTHPKRRQFPFIFIAGGFLAFTLVIGTIFTYTAQTGAAAIAVDSTAAAPTTNTSAKTTSTTKDGTYSVTTVYDTPGGREQMGTTLTIANGVITNVSIQPQATDRDSYQYQNRFAAGVRQYVVGKSIDSLNLNTVSGASLTTQSFTDAVAQISSQAAV